MSPKKDSTEKRATRRIQKETGAPYAEALAQARFEADIKHFATVDVIATFHATLLNRDRQQQLHDIAEHIAGRTMNTFEFIHTLPSIRSSLGRQHPWLHGTTVPEGPAFNTFTLNSWLADLLGKHGELTPVRPMENTP